MSAAAMLLRQNLQLQVRSSAHTNQFEYTYNCICINMSNYGTLYEIVDKELWSAAEGFLHEMGDGARCCKCSRPHQTELTGDHGAYGSYAPGSPIVLVRTAHLHLRERPPFSENCLVRVIPPYNSMQRCEK